MDAWKKLLAIALACWFTQPAFAQLAPSGQHYAGRPSDTGYGANAVDATGNLPATIPLDLPPARGGLPIPLQIGYGADGVGAVGLGWNLPLSYVRQSNTLAHGRPPSGAEQLPSLRRRTTLSLFGQNVDLLQQGAVWVARIGTLELTVRETADQWFAYDGLGRTYTFVHAATLPNAGLWLLKSVTGAAGAKVELTYQIVTWPLDGGSGTAIDLIGIAYNFGTVPLPQISCAKTEITLSYQNGSIKPVSLALLDDQVLVRKNTLSRIDVSARATCLSPAVRLRRYQFQYLPDGDTGLPRLSTVSLSGREGTPEETTPLPVGSYTYGSATDHGALHYKTTQIINLPTGVNDSQISGTDRDWSLNVPESGNGYSMWQTLMDFTGDGRPDLVFQKNDTLWIAKGSAGPAGSTTFGIGVQALVPLSDATLTSGAVSTQSSVQARFQYAAANRNTTDVWRQAIDINGDGRIDIIDAAEEADHWVVYLNTPGGPTGVKWERRSFNVKGLRELLVSSGHTINGDHVPLSRRATGGNLQIWQCWRWENNQWSWYADGFANHRCQGTVGQILQRGAERTYVEWELTDLNGDGYPDFVFDSDPVDFQLLPPPTTPKPQDGITRDGMIWEPFAPKATNQIRVAFNAVGVRFDTDSDAFSQSIDLQAVAADQGISQWLCAGAGPDAPCNASIQTEIVGLEDVNGDGLIDRVVGTRAYLGLYAGSPRYFSPVYLTLPGPLSTQQNTHDQQCKVGAAQKPTANQTQGLRDLTGDGIPDYFDNGQVWIGTGTGFQAPVGIVTEGAAFRFSHQTETCDGNTSNTDGGLYDIDGDGRPEVVGLANNTLIISQLMVNEVAGAPAAGRLTSIDNGYGATTNISYVSAKQFENSPLPFPEIVVSAMSTNGTLGLGGTLDGFNYAYGQGELVFDSAHDRFAFPGYARQVAMQLFHLPGAIGADGGKGIAGMATVTDSLPLAPFNLAMTKQQRWLRGLLAGRVSDVFALRAIVDPDPWALLGVTAEDSRLIGAVHYDFDAKLYELPINPAENVIDCFDIVAPLDFQATLASLDTEALDVCRAHGFAFQTASFKWHGDAPPPLSDQNIQTATQALSVDDFGRALVTEYNNDVFRSDDDVCVQDSYATPAAAYPRVMTALASRRVYACGKTDNSITVASESWIYDHRSDGTVTDGHMTSHSIDRRATDTGNLLDTIHAFDASYDADGNVATVQTQRDGATRTTAIAYDPFGLVPTQITHAATAAPGSVSVYGYDPASMLPLSMTDVSQTTHGTDYDGFGRPVRRTVTLAGGTPGVLSSSSYPGFGGGDPLGRRVTVTRFTDPVDPARVATTAGRSTTVFLDELDRERRAEVSLGADYANAILVEGARTYDGAGRVAFVADPFPNSEDPATAYGATYFFKNTGDLNCVVRAHGQQMVLNGTTDLVSERLPTCFQQSFAGHIATLDTSHPDALLAGSAQAGIIKRVVATAIGRTIERSTWQAGVRVEDSTFGYDRLGQRTSMTRFLDPSNDTAPVVWSSTLDSLGELTQLTEPATATRNNRYSAWGELTETTWVDGATQRALARSYDSLGRLTGTAERNDGIIDPDTVNTYTYDVAVNASPLVSPTFVLGQMASAGSPSGTESFSYDAFGRVNATVFADNQGGIYFQSADHHADGSLASLVFKLPDDNFVAEEVKYGYDSAGRLRTIKSADATGAFDLYEAAGIDVFGRVRAARYGGTIDYRADFAADGRRLMHEVAVKSALGLRRWVVDQYDPVNRQVSREEYTDSDATPRITRLSYDGLGRLAAARHTSGLTSLYDWTFNYDPLGNVHALRDLLGSAGATLSYQSADEDRVCRIGYDNGGPSLPLPRRPCNVVHDASGSVVSEPTRAGSRQLSYFSSGRARTITAGSQQATFAYDAFGAVASLDVQTGPGQSTHTGHFGGLIERRDTVSPGGTASLLVRNVPGPGGVIASRRGKGGDWIYPFGESRGNRFFVNQAGSFVQSVDYQPFGETTSIGAAIGTADYSDAQWNGGASLASLGLTQVGARIYDPVIGRFLSRDPLLIPRTAATTNPYVFAVNDPWNAADPTGMDCDGGIGQECQYMNSLTPVGFAVGLLETLFSGGASPLPAQAQRAPPVTAGPQTAAGQDLMAHSLSELGYAPKGFNFDTLAATGASMSSMLDNISQSNSAERDAAIDAYNAPYDSFSSFSAGFGDAVWFWCPGCASNARQQWGITSGDSDRWAYGVGSFTGIVTGAAAPHPTMAPEAGATATQLALPAPRQIEAEWGATNNYRRGGTMSAIEHINYRHAFESGFEGVSRFAEGTSVRDIQQYVDEALRYGTVTPNGTNGYQIQYNFPQRLIGFDQAGTAVSGIEIYVRDGIIQTAYPIP